jgi:hypothetical protein
MPDGTENPPANQPPADPPANQPPANQPPANPAPADPPRTVQVGPNEKSVLDAIAGIPEAVAKAVREMSQPPAEPAPPANPEPKSPPSDQSNPPANQPAKKRTFADMWFGTNK